MIKATIKIDSKEMTHVTLKGTLTQGVNLLDQMKVALVTEALAVTNNNFRLSTRILGVARGSFYRWIRQYKIPCRPINPVYTHWPESEATHGKG